MITLDEAIAHAREKAKEQRYYANFEKGAMFQSCLECAEEHEQLAKWLEELKELRTWKNDVMEDFCKVDCSSVGEVYQYGGRIGYNKAIDDFSNALADDLTWLMRFGDEVYIDVGNDVRIRAEQLKGGKNNEQ